MGRGGGGHRLCRVQSTSRESNRFYSVNNAQVKKSEAIENFNLLLLRTRMLGRSLRQKRRSMCGCTQLTWDWNSEYLAHLLCNSYQTLAMCYLFLCSQWQASQTAWQSWTTRITFLTFISQRKITAATPNHWSPTDDMKHAASRLLARQDSWGSSRLDCVGVYTFPSAANVSTRNSLCCVFASLSGLDSPRLHSVGGYAPYAWALHSSPWKRHDYSPCLSTSSIASSAATGSCIAAKLTDAPRKEQLTFVKYVHLQLRMSGQRC
jgi:hypothetical protein